MHGLRRRASPRAALRKDVRRIGLLLAASLLLGLALNTLHPMGLPLTLSVVKRPGVPRWIWARLQFTNASNAFRTLTEHQDAVLLDVRDRKDYQECHAAGAVSLPYHGFGRAFPRIADRVAPDRPVLLYCYGTSCGLSARVATRLVQRGYRHVTIIRRGFEAWEKAGLPVESLRRRGQNP